MAMVLNLLAFGSLMAFMDEAMKRSPKMVAWMIGWFCITILYYALLEGLWGAGAGKLLCGLRVAGPERNPPGVLRAGLRVLVYLVPPMLPYWLGFGLNPTAYLSSPQWVQLVVGFSVYVIMALLFVTARRRNGFAAVQDLVSGTRVISRTAFSARPGLSVSEAPPPNLDSAPTVGPYHVLQTLADSGGVKWVLAYDLKLLRKVWLREVPPETPPVPPLLRNLGRVGRLRWLTGKRSPEENWDAFEAPTGQPFLELVRHPQPWGEVRYWLHDLAEEISAAQKDGTLPVLALDRVWITVEGRAKLLDFSAPGLPSSASSQAPKAAAAAPPMVSFSASTLQPFNAFLNAVAATALSGSPGAGTQPAAEVGMPLALYAGLPPEFLTDGGRGCRGRRAQAAPEPGGGGFARAAGRARAGVHRLPGAGGCGRVFRPGLRAGTDAEEPQPDGHNHPVLGTDVRAVLGRQERAPAR
jgi:hypothetical protein